MDASENIKNNDMYTVDEEDCNIYHALRRDVTLTKNYTQQFIYVYAVQGKSLHTHIWNLHDLLESNSNLHELGKKIESDINNFVIPSGGIEAGLCNQVIIIQNEHRKVS